MKNKFNPWILVPMIFSFGIMFLCIWGAYNFMQIILLDPEKYQTVITIVFTMLVTFSGYLINSSLQRKHELFIKKANTYNEFMKTMVLFIKAKDKQKIDMSLCFQELVLWGSDNCIKEFSSLMYDIYNDHKNANMIRMYELFVLMKKDLDPRSNVNTDDIGRVFVKDWDQHKYAQKAKLEASEEE